jgi:hypothetical protein
MKTFITSLIILCVFLLLGIRLLFKKRRLNLIHYACQQSCELYQFNYLSDTLKPSENKNYPYQFVYQDGKDRRIGYIMTKKHEIKEIIFDKRSLDPRRDNPMFRCANEINNVVKFPKK